MTMRAVYVDRSSEMRDIIERLGPPVPSSLTIHDGTPSTADLIEYGREAQVLIVERTRVDAAVLDANRSIHTLIFMGTGAESYIDLPDAKRRGIRIMTTPGYGDRAVAEHAFALLLSAARQISRMDRDIRAGEWLPRGGLQLQGRKIAVIGLGGIGSAFAHIATAFGMQVAGWNRTPKSLPCFVPDLDATLQGADAVSLHLALNEDTQGLIDSRRLGLVRRGCLLVNTARGQLIDEQLLLEALTDGRIGHAALDVFHGEPLSLPNAYSNLSNVTLTSHAAYLTDDACSELWKRALKAFASLE